MRVVRTTVEATVLAAFALGATVGIGTVLYALAIGPVTHCTIPALDLSVRTKAGGRLPAPGGAGAGDCPPKWRSVPCDGPCGSGGGAVPR
jgi:hypothetical protein